MGIFIKFECDKCGEYEYDHSYEERMGYHPKPIQEERLYSKTEPFVSKGDVICHCATDTGDMIDEAVITKVTQEGVIWCVYIDGRDDNKEVEWGEKTYRKVCSVHFEKMENI